MTIETFLNEAVSLTIKRRGAEYYMQGAIMDLSQWNDEKWQATVEGNYGDYDVDVCVSREREVKSYSCNCPYDGEVCKHVVAVVMAIDKRLDAKPMVPIDTKKATIPEIIDKVDESVLRQFVQDFAVNNKEFRHLIDIKLSGNVETNSPLDSRQMLQKSLNMYSYHDYIGEDDVSDVVGQIEGVVEQAYASLKSDDYSNAFNIATVVIEEMLVYIDRVDDYLGEYWGTISEAFEVLTEVLNSEPLPKDIGEEIHTWCMELFTDTEYYEYCYEDNLTPLMMAATITPEQFEDMHDMLDEQITLRRKKDNDSYSYRVNKFLFLKIELYEKEGKQKEINRLIDDNMAMPDFRQIRIDECLEEKDYDKAIVLLNEGVRLCNNDTLSAQKWQEQLVEIYQSTGDTLKLRKVAKQLFLNARSALEYYRIYKSTFDTEAWQPECEKIIKMMRPEPSDRFYNPYTNALAAVFVEEKMWERLLVIVQGAKRIDVVAKHTEQLRALYPDELIAMYKKHVLQVAKNTGRKVYKEIAQYLRKMAKLKGGKECATTLAESLLKLYNNRPAMKDEFRSILR